MKKLLFTLNPHAGRGAIRDCFLDLVDGFVREGYDVTVHTTQKQGELPEYLAENAEKYEMLVSSGGDGTLNETVNGLMQCEDPPAFCYIPAGTVNDFATSLGISKEMREAGKLVTEGVPFACDVGRFGERYFSYVAAFGAFTEVSYQTPQQTKQVFGKLAYIAEGIKRLPTLAPYSIRVKWEGQEISGEFLYGMVSNSTSVAGMKLSEGHIYMNDGLFEVILVRQPENLSDRQAILNGLLKREPVENLLYFFRTPKLEIQSDAPLPWTLDGEFGGSVTDVTVENCPGAVKILVSPEASLPAQ